MCVCARALYVYKTTINLWVEITIFDFTVYNARDDRVYTGSLKNYVGTKLILFYACSHQMNFKPTVLFYFLFFFFNIRKKKNVYIYTYISNEK